MIFSLFSHKYLFLQMLKRSVQQRYRGSQLGFIWAFVYPLLMLLVYTFVFGFVMKAKWGVPGQDNLDFGIILFAGLLCHSLVAEVMVGSVTLITGNAQYVKKVVFPLELLSLVTLANALFHMVIGVFILVVMHLLTGHELHLTAMLAPVVLAPLVLFLLGASWFVSVLGVYVRDLGQFMGVFMTVLLFMAPIVYPFNLIPDVMQPYVYWLNPLTIIVEQFRAVMLYGQMPNWIDLGLYSLGAIFMFCIGQWFFKLTREGFADVI